MFEHRKLNLEHLQQQLREATIGDGSMRPALVTISSSSTP